MLYWIPPHVLNMMNLDGGQKQPSASKLGWLQRMPCQWLRRQVLLPWRLQTSLDFVRAELIPKEHRIWQR